MATMPSSRPGAGGKIVASRRRQRLAATPYDRPPRPPPSRSPSWFTGVLIPSARALASGAGKILSSAIFSDSESSSSEDLNSASEDDIDDDNEHESRYNQVNSLNEEKLTSSEIVQHGRESQFIVQKNDSKMVIERLIMQEKFSREECDRLIKVLNSRVMDWSREAGEIISHVNSPGLTVDHEDVGVSSKAVLEAKKWFQEKKKVGSSSVAQWAHGTCNLHSAVFDHIETGVDSPVDMARAHMRDKPPWASPREKVELRTPLIMKLFMEGTPYSVNHDLPSSSKRQSPLASGSWNIQDEIRKVRSKAIDDMLRSPPTKIDSSLFAVAPIREHSAGVMDVRVGFDPAPAALELREDGKARETPSSNPDASFSGNYEGPEANWVGGECVNAPSKFPYLTPGYSHAGEQHYESSFEHLPNLSFADPHPTMREKPSGTDAAEFGRRPYINGFASSQASLFPGEAAEQKSKQCDANRELNMINMEGSRELLSEAYMDVPVSTEANNTASDSQSNLGVECRDSVPEMTQPSTEGRGSNKQDNRVKNNRRGKAK